MRFSQVGPSDKSKPTVLISIGIQGKDAAGGSQDECSRTRKTYCKHSQDWQMQQPLYVEEPQWIEVDIDHRDSLTRHPKNVDPYIMSRGKKFRIKNPEKLEKTVEDYEEFLDYTARSKRLSTENRVRRSVEMTAEGFQGDAVDEKRDREEVTSRYNLFRGLDGGYENKISLARGGSQEDEDSSKIDGRFDEKGKKNVLAKPVRGIFIDRFEMNKSRNSGLLRGRVFSQRDRVAANDTLITGPVEEERKMQHEDIPSYIESGDDDEIGQRFHGRTNYFAVGANKGNEMMSLENGIFVRPYGKRGNRKLAWTHADYEDNIDRKKSSAAFERTRDDAYLQKLDNFSAYGDLFIPSRGKKPFDEGKKNARPSRSFAERWKNYVHRAEEKAKDHESRTNKDDARSTDPWSTNKPMSSSRMSSNYRSKRNIYEITPENLREDALLKIIEQEIAEKSVEPYLKPRDKHDILDLQNHLSTDPFFIMRGKKASVEPADAVNTATERQNQIDDVIRAIRYSTEEDPLKMLLTERTKCNEEYCDVNASRSLKGKPVLRNRRNSLDKLLRKYDPFVIIRGKKAKSGYF